MGKLIIGLILGLVIGVIGGVAAPAYNIDLPGMVGLDMGQSAGASASTRQGPQGSLRQALKKGLRQLKNGKKVAFVKNFMPPEARKTELGDKSLKDYAMEMPEKAIMTLSNVFKTALNTTPVLSDGGNTASFTLKEDPTRPDVLRFVKIADHWYMAKASR